MWDSDLPGAPTDGWRDNSLSSSPQGGAGGAAALCAPHQRADAWACKRLHGRVLAAAQAQLRRTCRRGLRMAMIAACSSQACRQ